MIYLNHELNKIGKRKTDKKSDLEREIFDLDNKINELVYEIYGLNKKEIAVVEESLKE